MLSKLALRKAFLQGAFDKVPLVGVRLFRTEPPESFKPTWTEAAGGDEQLKKSLANWEYANSLFYSPQRDHKNFPTLKMQDTTPPVRLGFLPDSWFQAFYEKTGVTGPYFFGAGLITFLLSKEIVIMEHQLAHFYSFWIAIIVSRYFLGKKVASVIEKNTMDSEERMFHKPIRDAKDGFQRAITSMEEVIKCEEGQKYLWESKKENVDLQLESNYRQRLVEVYKTVKMRLDYHVEVENLKKRIEQQNMVDWITRNVLQGITPQQEKESILQCISDLKSLAAKHPATA